MRLFLFFILLSVTAFASVNEDSLLLVAGKKGNDESRIDAYLGLSALYKNKDSLKALGYAGEAMVLSEQIKSEKYLALSNEQFGLVYQVSNNYEKALSFYQKSLENYRRSSDSSGVANAYNNIGLVFYFTADYPSAKVFFERSAILKIANNDSIGAGRAFNNTGIMLDIMGEPAKAIESYLKALSIYENMKRSDMMAGTMQNIGLIHINQKKYDEALDYYRKSIALALETEDLYVLATGYNSIGIIYDNKAEYPKALDYFLKALDISKKRNDNPGIAQALNNIAINYNYQGKPEKSLEYYLQSLKIKEEIGNRSSIAITQIGVGEAYKAMGNTGKAIKYFEMGLENANATGYKEYIKKAYEDLAYTYSQSGNFEKAFTYLDKFSLLKDSLLNEENNRVLEELKAIYESEKKENEIQLLNKENLLQESELEKSHELQKRKNLQIVALGFGLLMFIVLSLLILRTNRQRKKANEILTRKNEEISRQKEVIEEKNKSITESISYAMRLQEAILPPAKLVKEWIPESFVLYKPKDIVSGDFYWMENRNNKVLFAVVDCTGHGVPGAMVSVMAHNGLNRCVKEFGLAKPSDILDKLNLILDETFEKSEAVIRDGMDIALVSLDFESFAKGQNHQSKMNIQYAGANNPLWIIRNSNGISSFEEIKADVQPIGKYSARKPFRNHELQMNKGDSIYLFSDGYADQFGGPNGKKFKYRQFKELLISIQSKKMEEQKEELNRAIEKWKGDLVQIDDICIIGVRV